MVGAAEEAGVGGGGRLDVERQLQCPLPSLRISVLKLPPPKGISHLALGRKPTAKLFLE